MLQLLDLTRRFGAQVALDRVSLWLGPGDCYGFIGHNGAGKTTAMRIALGLARADAGRVLVDGFDAAERPREARVRMGGLIEVPGFHAKLGGRDNLVLLGQLAGLGRAEARAEAQRLLGLVGLAHAAAKPAEAYSHGMRQRLGIAQALLGRPRYVLLDEPTNGLDPEGIAEIREVLRRLTREEGFGVLLSSHQLHEVAGVCNRIGVLKQGRLLIEGPTDELLAAAGQRHELVVDDMQRARAVLAGLGIEVRSAERSSGSTDGALVFDPGAREPAAVARALVEAGLALARFGPRPASLEEIYLRASNGAEALPVLERGAVPAADAPAEALAPPRAVARMARYELVRWLARGRTPALLLAPAALGVLAIWMRVREAALHRALVEAGERFSTTEVTAFEAFGAGLGAGLALLAWVAAGLASQSIAGEFSRGTLRNVLQRPLSRWQVAAGKALAMLAMLLSAYLALAATCLAAAAAWFEFRDLAEVLPNGELFPLPGFAASDLWPHLRHALYAPLVPLAASALVGFAAGAVARSGAGALALALGLELSFDLARAAARGSRVEALLHTTYLPSPLGDSSFLKFYRDLSQGVSNTAFEFAGTALGAPGAWCLLAFFAAVLWLSRRDVP